MYILYFTIIKKRMDNVNRAPDRVPSTEKTILKVGTLLGKCSSGHFRKVALGTGESTALRGWVSVRWKWWWDMAC